MDEEQREKRIAEIKEEIATLEGNWPKHSPKPFILNRIEELEEELKKLSEGKLKDSKNNR